MNIRTPLLLVFALIMAGTTAFLARGWLDAQRAALLAAMQQQAQVEEQEEVPATYVLVAVNPMPTGHFVLPDDLARAQPLHARQQGHRRDQHARCQR